MTASQPDSGPRSAAAAPGITADVWFDTRCPWCFIGKRRFERAVAGFRADHPDVSVAVRHRSFELAPGIADRYSGTESDYLRQYEGVPDDHSARMLPELERFAADAGIEMRFDGLPLVNTRRAHRVFQLGAARGIGEEVLDRLFVGYFTEHRDLADPGTLGALVAEAGLDAADARVAADDPEWDAVVDLEQRRAGMLGIQGTPYYLLNARFAIPGATGEPEFRSALETVLAKIAPGLRDSSASRE